MGRVIKSYYYAKINALGIVYLFTLCICVRLDKKVILRERKRHTIRCVAGSGGGGGCVDRHVSKHYLPPSLGYPSDAGGNDSGTGETGIGAAAQCERGITQ